MNLTIASGIIFLVCALVFSIAYYQEYKANQQSSKDEKDNI